MNGLCFTKLCGANFFQEKLTWHQRYVETAVE